MQRNAVQESVNSFVQQLKNIWDVAMREIKHAQELQVKYYDVRHRPVEYDMS